MFYNIFILPTKYVRSTHTYKNKIASQCQKKMNTFKFNINRNKVLEKSANKKCVSDNGMHWLYTVEFIDRKA